MQAILQGRLAGRVIAWRIFPWSVRFTLRIGELFVVSCVVELAMTLPMAIYFHRITLFALPVNLFILPLLAVLMPAALLTLIVALMSGQPPQSFPPFSSPSRSISESGLVHLFGSFAFGDLRIPAPLLWQSLVFCALLAAAMACYGRCGSPNGSAALPVAALLLAALTAVAPAPLHHPRQRTAHGSHRRRPGRLASRHHS